MKRIFIYVLAAAAALVFSVSCKSPEVTEPGSGQSTIDEQKVRYILNLVKEGREEKISELGGDVICITAKGRPVKPKTLGQKNYVKAIAKNTITLGIGPAGISEFDFGLKRYIPKTASPITIAAISTHLVVLLINIRLI